MTKTKTKAVSAPYETTEAEQKAIAALQQKRAQRGPSPMTKVTKKAGAGPTLIAVDHPSPARGMTFSCRPSARPSRFSCMLSSTSSPMPEAMVARRIRMASISCCPS